MNTNFFCNIEIPSVVDRSSGNKLDVYGWVIDSDNQICRLIIRDQNGCAAQCEYGKERPDIKAAYPGIPNALHSGFKAELPMPDDMGNIEIVLEAELFDKSRRDLSKKIVKIRDSAQPGDGILMSFGSLSYPEEFDGDKLLSLSTLEPVFVVGGHCELFTATVSALQRVFETKPF